MMIESFSGLLHSPVRSESGLTGVEMPVLGAYRGQADEWYHPRPRRCSPLVYQVTALLLAGREEALARAVDLVLLVQVVVPADRCQDRLGVELGVEHDPGEATILEVRDEVVGRPDPGLVEVTEVGGVPDDLLADGQSVARILYQHRPIRALERVGE